MNQNYASSPTSPTSFAPPVTLIQGPCEKILTHKETDIYTHRYAKMIQQKCGKAEWSHCGIAGVQKSGNGKQNALPYSRNLFPKS
mgnify:CR=1 FL=1